MTLDRGRVVALDKQRVWHPYTAMDHYRSKVDPLVIVEAHGSTLVDADGREYLDANARAWRAGRRRFEADLQGVRYRLPTSRYRVWCLERLRTHFQALDEPASTQARALLEKHGCWEPLWQAEDPRSGHDPDGNAPFSEGLEVFGN